MPLYRLVVVALCVLLPGLALAPVWPLAGLGAGEDELLYYLPSRTFLHETLRAGFWPFMNPWVGLGRPYLADPQSAVFYPPTWLFGVMPPIQAYPVLLWAHYSLAFYGMYRLLRAQGCYPRDSVFGATAFALSGFLLGHRAHFTMICAVAWAPFVFWRIERLAHYGGGARWLCAAVVAALQCYAGHLQIAALCALGSAFWLAVSRRPLRGTLGAWLSTWLLAGLLYSAQLLPTALYLRECTRASQGFLAFTENSWNPLSAIGFLLPMFFGQRTPNFFSQEYWGPSHQCEQFAYAGILPLVLGALVLRSGWRADPARRAWILLAGFALLLALGRYGPLAPLLYFVPGASVFRVPARALFLVNLALAAVAAHALSELRGPLSPRHARLRSIALRWTSNPFRGTLLLLAPPLLLPLLVAPWLPADLRGAVLQAVRPWEPQVWVPALAMLLSVFTLGRELRAWPRSASYRTCGAVLFLDLAVIGWTLDVPLHHRSYHALLNSDERDSWATAISERGRGRLWTVTARDPSGLPGEFVHPIDKGAANTAMALRVPTLTDYGPLQPRAIVQRFQFRPWGESDAAEALLLSPEWMSEFNVEWVLLSERHWPEPPGGRVVHETPSGQRLVHRPPRGPTWFVNSAEPSPALQWDGPNAIWVECAPSETGATRRLVIANYAAPGWSATLDAKPIALHVHDSALLALDVPPAGGRVRLDYQPPGLRAGLIVSGVSGALAAVAAAFAGARTSRT